jgi:hypothetical protein
VCVRVRVSDIIILSVIFNEKMPIIQRPLTKSCARRSMEEVYSCARSHKVNQRLIWIYSYVLGTFSGILIALIMLKLVQIDNLILETTRPAEISQPTFLAPSSSSPLDLYNDIRILCFILTHPTNHLTKAQAVANTWGKRCNKLVFISSASDESLDVITVNITEEHKYLWGKTKQGLQQIYELYGNDFDWYLKADDDTWIFMENLRQFLHAYSPSHPIYFGCKLKPYVQQGYMSGSSYVMSREAVRRFNEEALTDDYKCWNGTMGNEDVEIGKCLQNVGVLAGDSRDDAGKWRFLPFTPEGHLRNLFGPSWLDNASYYEIKTVR